MAHFLAQPYVLVTFQVFVVGISLTGFGVISTVNDYLSYPVMTKVSVREEDNVDFPAVTICNLNRVNCENLHAVIRGRQYSNYTEKLCKILILGECIDSGAVARFREASECRNVGPPVANDDEAEMMFGESYNGLPSSLRVRIGHRMRDTIVRCRMNGKACDLRREFRSFSSFKYGTCFSFNDYLVKSRIKVGRAGPSFGLELELFLDATSHLGGGLSPASGFRVGIAQQDSPVDLENVGVNLEPGKLTSLGLKMRELSRLADPYPSDCHHSWDRLLGGIGTTEVTPSPESLSDIRYTNLYCQRVCLLVQTKRRCDCYNTDLDVNPAGFLDRPGLRICSKMNASDAECTGGLFEETSTCPQCHAACREMFYERVVSTAVWPAERNLEHYANDARMARYGDGGGDRRAWVRREFSRVEIYLDGKEVTKIEEEALITSKNLVTSLGGALSLFLGMSFVTLMEVAELTAEIVFSLFPRWLAVKTAK